MKAVLQGLEWGDCGRASPAYPCIPCGRALPVRSLYLHNKTQHVNFPNA